MNIRTKHTNNPLTFGLAMTAGLGIILMITALALGVIQGAAADANALGLLLVAGLIVFIVGVAGWVAVVQPHRNFDDINVPKDTGHHAHAADESHADDEHGHAAVVSTPAHH